MKKTCNERDNYHLFPVPLGDSSLRVLFDKERALADKVFLRDCTARHFATSAALFRTFADLAPGDKNAIAKFRASFSICDDDATVVNIDSCEPVDVTTKEAAEALRRQREKVDWGDEVLAMSRCIHLWQEIQAEDAQKKLAPYIKWQSDPSLGLVVLYDSSSDPDTRTRRSSTEVIASEKESPDLILKIGGSDRIGPASIYIERSINSRLKSGIIPGIVAAVAQRTVGKAKAAKALSLERIPCDFLATVWLQLAEAIDRDRQYAHCKECGLWFEKSCAKTHADRKFCSDLCKVDGYRQRKKASQYAAEGKPPREIAKLMNTDVETIKRWTQNDE